ncbi:DUF6443 domain-containing protein [Sphingobacterium paramultivorum]|uniref:DUF6443 domain-containing protein n=1 Tax=Sphingobacterium paramultivorum TaxID=2886510 RepID=UPI00129C32BC|nr:GH-E family nuclease [Sphingobacterium paramultivorum]
MKKYIAYLIILFSGVVHAQLSTAENYVQSRNYLDYNGLTPTKTSETVQYFDGLGRPKQVVNVKASPLSKDVVTKIKYDQLGRQTSDYLPVPQSVTQNGGYYDDPLANAPNTPYGNEKIYAEKLLENSPLDRILNQKQVGNAWDSKPIQYAYDANIDGEVKKYTATFNYTTFDSSITLSTAGYSTGQLYKNTIIDEDGNKTIEFENGKGQLVLQRKVIDATHNADTYYVYNDYNQLAYIIPPLAAASNSVDISTLNNLCYQYKYDKKNRLVEKKLPGKGLDPTTGLWKWDLSVYDNADRLIFTQDGNLNSQGKWLFTKYDKFGRVIITGIVSGGDRASMQELIGNTIVVENRDDRGFAKSDGMRVYYTNSFFPSFETVLTVNYYDVFPDYNFTPTFPTTILGAEVLSESPNSEGKTTNNLLLLSLIKSVEDNSWTKIYYYYSTKGRIIGTHSINYLGGYTRVENQLDFSGVTQQTVTHHKRLPSDSENVIIENFIYDHQNRLLKQTHQVNGYSAEILAQNDYNELSQLKTKKVGGVSASLPVQSIDYAYNIRGWMTKINDPTNLNGKLFGYEIRYTDPQNTSLASGKYNGNIAEVDWITAKDGILKKYSYQYDGLNRLLSGIYTEPFSTIPQNNSYNETLRYDLNGNIISLQRNNYLDYVGLQQMDNLTYNYTGNRLNTVTDSSTNYLGYPDSSGNVMNYDLNGNMIDHVDKGILQLSYNHLNLPNYVKFNEFVQRGDPFFGGIIVYKNINYLYRADGVKLRKKHNYFSGRTQTDASTTTEYLDGFQYSYEQGLIGVPSTPQGLQFIPTTEGYYDFQQNKYIYQYKDQVGNIRLSYYKDDLGNAVIDRTTDYYPFGLEFGGSSALNTFDSVSPNYTYTFQGQEKQQETGWNSFKWRNYDPSMGRFFNVDPLSEKYSYQSHYNFSENRVVDNVELEGLEGEDFRFRMAMKQKGGIQARAEKEDQEANSAAFMAVIKTVTPIEELYTLASGRDLDGNPASRTEAVKLLALSLVPEVKGEAKAASIALKAEAKADAKAAAKAEEKIVSKKPYSKSRPSYGKDQVETVWETAKQKDGKVYDPNTGEELKWDKTKRREWDMGHKPGKEYRKLHKDYMDGKITKDEFLKEYKNPDNYQPESKSANRSGRYEHR